MDSATPFQRHAKTWLTSARATCSCLSSRCSLSFPFSGCFGGVQAPSRNLQYIYPVSWKTFIPETWTLENFQTLMELKPYSFTHYILNSLFVAVAVTLRQSIVNSMAAYAFAKLKFPGQNVLFAIFRTTIIPFEVIAIPLYLR